MKHKISLFNCQEMLTSEMADIIIPLHIISGCDHHSGFFGHGKKSFFEKVKRDRSARDILDRIGENIDLSDDVFEDMKIFILSKMYSESVSSCGEARASKWRKIYGSFTT